MRGPPHDGGGESQVSQRQDILKRRKAVGNIRTVTRTMQFIASSRLAQAQRLAQSSQSYTRGLAETVGSLIARNGEALEHALLSPGPADAPVLLIVLSSNRGLCGGFNNNVAARAKRRREQLIESGQEVHLCTIGRKVSAAFRREGIIPDADYDTFDSLPARPVVRRLMDRFLVGFAEGHYSAIEIVYPQFASAGQQHPVIAPLVPITDLPEPHTPAGFLETPGELELEPSLDEILERLIPEMVHTHAWQCFADALAGEHAQRYRAMQQANDNAEEMTKELTLKANTLRQGQITTELSEIVGGRAGLEAAQE